MNIDRPVSIKPDNLELPVLPNNKLQPISGNICFDPTTKNIYINDGTTTYTFVNSSIPPSLSQTNQHFNIMQSKSSLVFNYSGNFGSQFFNVGGAATTVNRYDPYSVFINYANIGDITINNNISGTQRVILFNFSASVKNNAALNNPNALFQIQLYYNGLPLTTLSNFTDSLIQTNYILPVSASTTYTVTPQGDYKFSFDWSGGDTGAHIVEFDWVNCGITIWPLSSI